jgi:hypothetical protein
MGAYFHNKAHRTRSGYQPRPMPPKAT